MDSRQTNTATAMHSDPFARLHLDLIDASYRVAESLRGNPETDVLLDELRDDDGPPPGTDPPTGRRAKIANFANSPF